MHMRSRITLVVSGFSALLLFVALSACSSASSAAPGTSASKSPIYVGASCQLSSAVDTPECYTVTQAYFDSINAQGGVDGRPLKVVPCDNQSNPADATTCIRGFLASKNILALVGDSNDEGFAELAKNSPIANIAPLVLSSDDIISPDAFPISGWGLVGEDSGAVAKFVSKSVHPVRPGTIYCNLSPCAPIPVQVAEQFPSGQLLKLSVALDQTSYTPDILTAKARGVNYVFVATSFAGVGDILTQAAQYGYSPYWGMSYSCFGTSFFAALAPGNYNALCPSMFEPWWTAAGAQMKAVMDKYGPTGWQWNTNGMDSWVGAHIFVQVLRSIHGSITRQAILAGVRKLTHFTNSLLVGSLDFSAPGPSFAPALHDNDSWLVFKVNSNKTFTLLTKTPLNVAPLEP